MRPETAEAAAEEEWAMEEGDEEAEEESVGDLFNVGGEAGVWCRLFETGSDATAVEGQGDDETGEGVGEEGVGEEDGREKAGGGDWEADISGKRVEENGS